MRADEFAASRRAVLERRYRLTSRALINQNVGTSLLPSRAAGLILGVVCFEGINHTMSEWRDISTAPRDGVFVLLHNDNWASDVEGFWHKGSQSWSANTRIPGIENRVISPEPPTHWKPLTVEEEKY
jgi:hypothetical protein